MQPLSNRPRVKVDAIKRAVADHYKIHPRYMKDPCRRRKIARPRQVAMYLCRQLTVNSYPCLGRLFARDHTTVLHAKRRIIALMEADPEMEIAVNSIERKLLGEGA